MPTETAQKSTTKRTQTWKYGVSDDSSTACTQEGVHATALLLAVVFFLPASMVKVTTATPAPRAAVIISVVAVVVARIGSVEVGRVLGVGVFAI